MTIEISKSLYKSMKIICNDVVSILTCSDLKNAWNFFGWSAFPFITMPEFIQRLTPEFIARCNNKHNIFYEAGVFFLITLSGNTLIMAAFNCPAKRKSHFEAEAVHYFNDLKLAAHFIDIENNSKYDAMTGLYNHGYFENTLKDWFFDLKKNVEGLHNLADLNCSGQTSVGLIIFDIDNFKKFNDVYGHKTGDIVLIEVARAAERALAGKNFELKLCRYGGEEFVIIGKNISNGDLAVVAEAARAEIEALDTNEIAFKNKIGMKLTGITVSVGTAFYDIYSEYISLSGSFDVTYAISALVEKADTALYGAKQLGKNRVLDYKDIAVECGTVISRIDSQNVLIDLGLKHGINFESSFLVYDSKYDGRNEVINPRTSKKIGVFPRYLKGEIKVSKNLKTFDSVLNERTAVCTVISESDLKIGAGDIIKLKNISDFEVFNDDIFLNYNECGIDNYIEISKNTAILKDSQNVVMINARRVIDFLRYNSPGRLAELYQKLSDISGRIFKTNFKEFYLSSDKILMAFSDIQNPAGLEKNLLSLNEKLKTQFEIKSCDFNFIILDKANLKLPDSDIVKFLRSGNFVSRFYFNNELIRNFNAETYRLFGIFCHLCDNNAAAYKILTDCCELFKNDCNIAHFQNLGTIAARLGRYCESENYYKIALKKDENNIHTCANLALIFASTGKYEAARKLYEKLIKIAPDCARFYNNLAYCLLELKNDAATAREMCLKAIKKSGASEISEFLDTLAVCNEALSDFRAAEVNYLEALRRSSGAISAYIKLLEFYKRLGDRKKFMNCLKKIKAHPLYFSKTDRIKSIAESFHSIINAGE